jgi:hypothetical protein
MARKINLFIGFCLLLFVSMGVSAQSDCAPNHLDTSQWATDFCQTNIKLGEIRSGGPGKDGIPALFTPQFESIAQAQTWLSDVSPLIVVVHNKQARAYPQAILMWHEIVNDTMDDLPIAVTFCPLCNSSIVFNRQVGDALLEFGVSGNLRNSDMVMYDRQTDSWWQQFTGEGIVGVYTDTLLDIVPSQVMGLRQFATQYPDGEVLSRDTGYTRQYGINPYVGYDSMSSPFLFDGEVDERLPSLSRVLGVYLDNTATAYPLAVLQAQQLIQDEVGETPIVAFWQGGVASALDASNIDESVDIGTALLFSRQLTDGRVLSFRLDNGVIVDDETNSIWSPFGIALDGELEGTQLTLLASGLHFWFAWHVFYPDTRLYDI